MSGKLFVIVEFGSSGCKLCFYDENKKNVTNIGKGGNLLHEKNTNLQNEIKTVKTYNHYFKFDSLGEIRVYINNGTDTEGTLLPDFGQLQGYTIECYTIFLSSGNLNSSSFNESDGGTPDIMSQIYIYFNNKKISYYQTQDNLPKIHTSNALKSEILKYNKRNSGKILEPASAHEAKIEAASYYVDFYATMDFSEINLPLLLVFIGGQTLQIGVYENEIYRCIIACDCDKLSEHLPKLQTFFDTNSRINLLLSSNANFILNELYTGEVELTNKYETSDNFKLPGGVSSSNSLKIDKDNVIKNI